MSSHKYGPWDRTLDVIGTGVPDRIPVFTYSCHFQIRWAGFTFGEIMKDTEKFIEAQLKALDYFGYDEVTNLGGPGMIAESLGAELIVPEDESPTMTTAGLTETPNQVDFETLRSVDVTHGAHIPMVLEVTEKLREGLGPRVPLIAAISSPFREACLLRGSERLLVELIKDRSFVLDLSSLMTDKIYEYAKLAVDAGADILGFTDPFASSSMISLRHFREMVYPFEKELIERIHDNTQAKVLFHTCGEWGDRFDLAVDAGADIYHVDGVGDMDLGEITKSYGNKTAIMGRLTTTKLLLNARPDEVRKAAEISINAAGPGGNYILGGNCSLAPDTPAANLKAMIEAAHEKGVYPLKETMNRGYERTLYLE